jgi:hypothetical protein
MVKTNTQTQIAQGTLFEYRVARLMFWQGSFVRRSIDVWPNRNEGQQLAEVDCIAVSFDPRLHKSLEIVECKTGRRGQGEIDRLLWLKGFGSYTKANTVTFSKLNIASRTRDFAKQIGVDVLDEAAILNIEQDLNIYSDQWIGFHNPEFGENIVKPARALLTSSENLRRAGKYLFGTFWFTDDFTRIKQLRTLFGLLNRYKNDIPREAYLLGLGEATTLFTLTTLSISSWRNQLSDDEFRNLISNELSTGLADPHSLRSLLRRIDSLQQDQIERLHNAYQENGVGRIPFVATKLELEILQPPEWVDAFVHLIIRIARRPHLATNIVQWMDLWAADLLGAKTTPEIRRELFYQKENILQSGQDLILAFLERQWEVKYTNTSDKEIDTSEQFRIQEAKKPRAQTLSLLPPEGSENPEA